MFTLFYRNSRLLILTIILIAVWGVSSYFTLPRLEDPELVSRTAVITTFFPGADAERVEALVTEKIEDKLPEIQEIDNFESTSRTGSSIITIELQESVSKEEVDSVWTRVRNKIDEVQVELPNNIVEPELEEVKVKAYALIAGLTWKQDDKPNYGILRRQAEVFKERLEAISGTEEVEIFGDPNEEIIVEINPEVLASYNLTARDLSQQIAQSDSKISAGQLRDKENNLLIQVAGELDTLARIRKIPINFGNQGQFVTLQNIATIRKGIKEPANELALLNGHPGVAIAVHVESGRRLDLWSSVADKKIAEFKSELPSSIGLPIIFAQSGYVTKRLNSLILNLLLGAGLVFGVTVIMMGLKSAIIVSSALPLSVFMVFGWMNFLNIPLHQMSITGLIVALGILIENAIVMVDEVQNELRTGVKPLTAINHSIKNLAIPLLSSTLTTVLAFLPIALLPGSTGEFVGTIAITVIVAVCCSLFISLGLFSVWLFGYPFGFNPIIGTVGLIGVAVNDSIVVLSAISNHPIAKTGNPTAIQKVVLHSTRHVLTTTITTAIGFVPLLLSGGEFWPPLAVAIAGGVVGATLLALYFVPAAYYLIKSKFKNKNRSQREFRMPE